MAKRSVCSYNENYIGIEEIFTVVDGKQVNIPGKVEWLRKLGRENLLFCPCGCGNNLVVVAGDSGLREQHFRIKETDNGRVGECSAVFESEESILSKIALKCWLDEKLGQDFVSTRVLLKDLVHTDRKFELSFYSKERSLAVCFWNERNHIDSEKINMVYQCSNITSKLFMVSEANSGITNTGGQYPEYMIKLHKVQGYNLYLHLKSFKVDQIYEEAELIVKTFIQLRNGFWREIPVLSAPLKNYYLSDEGRLVYDGRNIAEYVQAAVDWFIKKESEQIKNLKKENTIANKATKRIRSIERVSRWKEPEFDETPEEKAARKIRENEEWLAEQDAKNRRRKGL